MPEGQSSRQLVVFSLGAEEYALPIEQVHEIIRYTEPRAVAASVEGVRGVISLRGKIVPVYDLAARLGVASEPSERAKIVIVETGAGHAGVVVDDVEEVLTVDTTAIDDAPAGTTAAVEAIAKLGERLVILLNPDGIFSGELAAAA
jgi:purine-binding chemotaxis protein CheW